MAYDLMLYVFNNLWLNAYSICGVFLLCFYQLANQYKVKFFETSAWNNICIEESFSSLTGSILQGVSQPSPPSDYVIPPSPPQWLCHPSLPSPVTMSSLPPLPSDYVIPPSPPQWLCHPSLPSPVTMSSLPPLPSDYVIPPSPPQWLCHPSLPSPVTMSSLPPLPSDYVIPLRPVTMYMCILHSLTPTGWHLLLLYGFSLKVRYLWTLFKALRPWTFTPISQNSPQLVEVVGGGVAAAVAKIQCVLQHQFSVRLGIIFRFVNFFFYYWSDVCMYVCIVYIRVFILIHILLW